MLGSEARAAAYEKCRGQLVAYAGRMVTNHGVAEDLAQEAALRLLADRTVPEHDEGQVRAWLFRVVTNLALDHLRRHSTWRELPLIDARDRAARDPTFTEASLAMRGTPEVQAIAREHLSVCFSCTLRNLSPRQAASLLLREVYGLTIEETGAAVDASFGQVKNWIQEGRAELERRYQATCALVNKQGVCYQCTELDGFFNGQRRDPLEGSARNIDARLELLRAQAGAVPGPWHKLMFDLMDDLLGERGR